MLAATCLVVRRWAPSGLRPTCPWEPPHTTNESRAPGQADKDGRPFSPTLRPDPGVVQGLSTRSAWPTGTCRRALLIRMAYTDRVGPWRPFDKESRPKPASMDTSVASCCAPCPSGGRLRVGGSASEEDAGLVDVLEAAINLRRRRSGPSSRRQRPACSIKIAATVAPRSYASANAESSTSPMTACIAADCRHLNAPTIDSTERTAPVVS